jgi:uncharacterized repeat protein (TIGR01451 family)
VTRSLCIAAVVALFCVPTAQASVTLGQTTGATDSCGNGQVWVQATTAAASPSYVAQSAGVVVSWSYLAHASAPSIRFKVYKPTADPKVWFDRSESALKAPGSGADQVHPNQLNTFAESPGLPIEAGDHLGLTALGGGTMGCVPGATGDVVRVRAPPDSSPGADNGAFNGTQTNRVDVSAVVEPDADGDGYGDETQDSCPTDATVHTGGCPVEVSIVKTVSAGAKVGSALTYTLAVKNNNTTNPAGGVSVIDPLPAGVTFVSSAAGQGSCSGTTNVTCAIGSLGPGQATSVTIVVKPTAPGTLSNTASVTTTSSDTDTADNSSTATTNVAPLPPVISAFKLTPATFRARHGTLVSYRLSEASATTFTVYKRGRGVRRAGRCVKRSKKTPKSAKACTLLVRRGSFVSQDPAGPVSFRYKGRVKGKTLKPGRYKLVAVATDVSGPSRPASANFRIKK